jgi:hypothetical protein
LRPSASPLMEASTWNWSSAMSNLWDTFGIIQGTFSEQYSEHSVNNTVNIQWTIQGTFSEQNSEHSVSPLMEASTWNWSSAMSNLWDTFGIIQGTFSEQYSEHSVNNTVNIQWALWWRRPRGTGLPPCRISEIHSASFREHSVNNTGNIQWTIQWTFSEPFDGGVHVELVFRHVESLRYIRHHSGNIQW